MEKTREEIEKDIINFLDGGGYCALGTCKDNIPRVTPVSFENEGMNLWVIGDPGGKIENIKANPRVSVGVYSRIEDDKDNISLQIFGKAELVTYDTNKNEFMDRAKKRGMIDRLESRRNKQTGLVYSPFLKKELPMEDILRRIAFIKIIPDEVVYLHIKTQGGGTYKAKWKRQ